MSGSALSAEDVDPQEVMTSDVCPDSDMAICLPDEVQLKTSKDRTPLHGEGGSTPKGFGCSGYGQRNPEDCSGRFAVVADNEPDGDANDGQDCDRGKYAHAASRLLLARGVPDLTLHCCLVVLGHETSFLRSGIGNPNQGPPKLLPAPVLPGSGSRDRFSQPGDPALLSLAGP